MVVIAVAVATIDFWVFDKVQETWLVHVDFVTVGGCIRVLWRVLDAIWNMCESLESISWLPSDSGSWRDWEVSDAICWVSIANWNKLIYIILTIHKSDFTNILNIKSSCPNSFDLVLSESRILIWNLVDKMVKRHFFSIIEISFIIQVLNSCRIITKDIFSNRKSTFSTSL